MDAPFWHIIVNPAAGNGRVGRVWPDVEQALQRLGFSYTVHFTQYKRHAIRLVDDIVLRGGRYLMGIGGDGTNHELVNGIMTQQHVPSDQIHYALLPFGTGNDWARQYNLPTDPRRRLAQLQQLHTVWQDVGSVTYYSDGVLAQRYFANVAGMAYDAYVVRQSTEDGHMRNRLVYLAGILRHLFNYKLQPARLEWETNAVEDYFYTINVGVCRYSGGGMQIVPQAIPDDGLLALTFARRMPKWEIILQTKHFYDGSLLRHPKLTGTQVQQLRVTPLPNTTTLIEADGEFLGEAPAHFSVRPKALCVAV